MTILLFVFYFIILLLIVNRIIKKTQLDIGFGTITAMFSFKVLLGCLYGYVFLHYYGGDDTWTFFNDSIFEYQKMIHHPAQFFKDISPVDDFNQADSFFQFVKQYLYDLEYWLMRKLLAVFNIFSRGNYYIDTLFFDFVLLWGPLLLFKLLRSYFPSKKTIIISILFFIPSVGFWLSGIRAEGLIFLFMVITIYYSAKCFNKPNLRYLILTVIGIAGMLIFRGVFLLVFIPAFLSFVLTSMLNRKAFFIFIIVYIISVIIFFGSSLVSENNNLPASVVSRQQEFFQLHGKTVLQLDSLQPTFQSFLKISPQAFSNVFFHPFIWEAKGILQIISSLDVLMFWFLIIILLIFHEKNWRELLNKPVLILFLFYGFTLMLLIGFIVPFPGAIVRYKAIPELLLLSYIALGINYKKTIKL